MSNDPYDYNEDGNNQFAVPGLTDRFQVRGLGPRVGDVSPRHNSNARWGATVLLHPQQAETVISTEMFDSNIPIALQLRWAALVQGPYSPVFPIGLDDGALVKLLKSIDYKAGAANESFTLFPGQRQPTCVIVCRQLQVTVKNLSTNDFDSGSDIFLQAAACRVTNVDCDEIIGGGQGYDNATETFVPASTTVVTLLAANSRRAQFVVQNTSNGNMLLKFGTAASFVGPSGTVILPANSEGIYESPVGGYRGAVTAIWQGGGLTGGAIVTEGVF